jgi:hypothetical protein
MATSFPVNKYARVALKGLFGSCVDLIGVVTAIAFGGQSQTAADMISNPLSAIDRLQAVGQANENDSQHSAGHLE